MLVFYEYLITLNDEIIVVRKRGLSGGVLLLLSTRYTMTVLALIALLPYKLFNLSTVRLYHSHQYMVYLFHTS